jgi:hypothetical protein
LAETAEVRIEQGDIDARDLAVHLLDVGLGRVESYYLLRLEPIRCQLQASSINYRLVPLWSRFREFPFSAARE